MCGFAGILNSKNKITKEDLQLYARKVSFRGPDSCGLRLWNDALENSEIGTHAIFFNRLAIIDLDHRSDQPFEDQRFLLVFNGEIYNYHNLKSQLQAKGVSFKTTSDTEVLFYLLREHGIGALGLLNGMFAFFWLDKFEKKFILARDRVGIKPLYYTTAQESFSFGSELQSILKLSNIKPEISADTVNMYLWMQFTPAPHTIIKGVSKLPPGHYISGTIDRVSAPIPYWDAYMEVFRNSQSNVCDLEIVLKESIERQLQADVPLGLFLSSGVDSSLLAAIINKYFANKEKVNLFTVAFDEETASNESEEAISFIKGFKNPFLINTLLNINADLIGNHLDKLYNFYDEPFGDPAALLNWVIAEKAKEHVTVCISGDGADELFWGYSRYNKWQQIARMNRFPSFSKTVTRLSHLIPSFSKRNKIHRAFQSDPVKSHFDLFLMPAFRPFIPHHITKDKLWALENARAIHSRKDATSLLDIKTYLADGMLYKVDRSSMAASLEVRVPYLDNEVIDFALSLPFEKKSNKKYQNKAILKDLLLNLAPHYNISKPKKGFSFPLDSWLRSNWKEKVLSLVTPETLEAVKLDPAIYYPIISDFYNKNSKTAVEVWYIFNLILWSQQSETFKTKMKE